MSQSMKTANVKSSIVKRLAVKHPAMKNSAMSGQSVIGWALALSVLPLSAVGSTDIDSDPLWVENLSPLAGLVALPTMRSAEPASGWQVDVHTAIASHFVAQELDDESVFFDGETTRISLAAEYGFAPDWSARVTLPWVSQDGGFLDSTINSWHDFFGMSDGGRSQFPDDQFRYRYTGPEHAFDVVEEASGIGDVRAELNHVIHRDAGRVAAVAVGYKFGTGDEETLQGSGSGDVFAVLRFSGRHLSDLPLTWHGQLGYTYAGDAELIGPEQRNNLWFVGVGLDWRINKRWSFLAQYDGHSAVMNSELDGTGEGGTAMLSLGTRWRMNPEWHLDLSFIEDIKVESAPDVTFQATLRWGPQD